MIHPQPRHDPAAISDRELGLADFLLLLVVVLAVAFVPAIA
jgi:hypothetical protein